MPHGGPSATCRGRRRSRSSYCWPSASALSRQAPERRRDRASHRSSVEDFCTLGLRASGCRLWLQQGPTDRPGNLAAWRLLADDKGRARFCAREFGEPRGAGLGRRLLVQPRLRIKQDHRAPAADIGRINARTVRRIAFFEQARLLRRVHDHIACGPKLADHVRQRRCPHLLVPGARHRRGKLLIAGTKTPVIPHHPISSRRNAA